MQQQNLLKSYKFANFFIMYSFHKAFLRNDKIFKFLKILQTLKCFTMKRMKNFLRLFTNLEYRAMVTLVGGMTF